MPYIVGIAIHRRSIGRVLFEQKRGTTELLCEAYHVRPEGADLGEILREELAALPADYGSCGVRIALSPADLACADTWLTQPVMKSAMVAQMAGILCEQRCAGEAAEDLAADVHLSGESCQSIAIRSEVLGRLLSFSAGARVELVSAIPFVLGRIWGSAEIVVGGERISVSSSGFRTSPVDLPDSPETITWRDREIDRSMATAVAAAMCDPAEVPNLLNSIKDGRNAMLRRLRDPLVGVAAALVLCLAGAGVRFHRAAEAEREDLVRFRNYENEFWMSYLPSERPRAGKFLDAAREKLAGVAPDTKESGAASALRFWDELARQMPDPDSLGLVLESLDLGPDGGSLAGHVGVVKDDPLRNAVDLEGKLNGSRTLKARGEYEVRDDQVQVRVRLTYNP